MSLTLTEIAELKTELENDIRDMDGQIEYLETMYLEETKEPVSRWHHAGQHHQGL